MAEVIQKRMERFGRIMHKIQVQNILPEKEVKRIIKKASVYEYKLISANSSIYEFQEAIKFYIGVCESLAKPRDTTEHSTKQAEWHLINTIVSVYQRGLQVFNRDYEFHLAYFEYLKPLKQYHNFASEHLQLMLQRFPDKFELYFLAYNYHKNAGQFKQARDILLIADDQFPQRPEVYVKLLELDIVHSPEEVKQARLMVYVENALNASLPRRFIQETILILDKEPSLKEVKDYAMEKYFENHKNEVETYDFLAKLILKEVGRLSPRDINDPNRSEFNRIVQKAVDMYTKGIEELGNDLNECLFGKYIDLLQTLTMHYKHPTVEDLVWEATNVALTQGVPLTIDQYLLSFRPKTDQISDVIEKYERGLTLYRDEAKIWREYLRFLMGKSKWDEISQVFERGIEILGEKATDFVEEYLDILQLGFDDKQMTKFFEKFIHIRPHANLFKISYLKHQCMDSKLYLRLATLNPPCRQLHLEMYKYQRVCNYKDHETVEKLLQFWSEQFQNDLELYQCQVQFVHATSEIAVRNEQLQKVYNDALKNLTNPSLVNQFKEQFPAWVNEN